MWSESDKTGIYFLIKGNDVVYIGKTTKYPMRLKYHIHQKLDFDTVKFIECTKDNLAYYEKRWIERFKPAHNLAMKPKQKAYIQLEEHSKGKKVWRYHMKFRKLTRLSRIGFGSYKERTVGNMIDAGRVIDLIQMYFNLSHITFFDDILDDLKITQEWRIAKPGNDRDLGRKFNWAVYPDEMNKRMENGKKREYKQSKITLQQIAMKREDKAYHMRKNHGH